MSESLKDLRNEQGDLERAQTALMIKFLKQQRQNFDYADTMQHIAQQQNEDDLLILGDSLVKWITKLKPDDPRKKEFTLLLEGVWRIGSYCGNLQTICKSAVARYIQIDKDFHNASSKLRIANYDFEKERQEYEKTIENLRKEIQFINSSKIS